MELLAFYRHKMSGNFSLRYWRYEVFDGQSHAYYSKGEGAHFKGEETLSEIFDDIASAYQDDLEKARDEERPRPAAEAQTQAPQPQAPSGGISKEELQQAIQAAVQGAAQNQPQPAASQPAVSKEDMQAAIKQALSEAQPRKEEPPAARHNSDIDRPRYKLAPNPNNFAVVVGVEKYTDLPEARFADRDADAVRAHLEAMGYPRRNIVLLTGARATRTGLVKNVETMFAKNVNENSTVFFYYSGHGAPDPNTGQAYLVPVDGDPQYLKETSYPLKRLYAKLGALRAKRVIVALDSCFSGAGGRSVLAKGIRPLVHKIDVGEPRPGKIIALSASESRQVTGTFEEKGHGLFTYYFLKALADADGSATIRELYDSLRPHVQDEARRQNRDQTPQLAGATADERLR